MSKMYLNGHLYGGVEIRGDYACDLLYENTDFSVDTQDLTIYRTYTMLHSLNDYDEVVVYAYLHSAADYQAQLHCIKLVKSEFYTTSSLDNDWGFEMNGSFSKSSDIQRRFAFRFVDSTTLNTVASRNDFTEEPKLYKVYGIKYGSQKTDRAIYGFHIENNEPNPSNKVTYLKDAVDMTPAHMDYTNNVFNYGSWGNAWFIKECKPCILNQDGTVRCYLNKNDYSKDIDGNSVTIDSNLTGANVMIEFPKIWLKVEPSRDQKSADVFVSPTKIDDGYKDYAYISKGGVHREHFYMPAYNGSLINNVLRSISGQATMKSITFTNAITYAESNGSGWYIENIGEVMLINFLLILMSKSTDTQTAFGKGITTGGETACNNYITGTGNTKGLFWGSNDGTQLVKIFGIENWWGLQWRQTAGCFNISNSLYVKMCFGREDGSDTDNYNIDGKNYVNLEIQQYSAGNDACISEMCFEPMGMFPKTNGGGSTSTYYCDVRYYINNSTPCNYDRGGCTLDGDLCGAFATALDQYVSEYNWHRNASVSF